VPVERGNAVAGTTLTSPSVVRPGLIDYRFIAVDAPIGCVLSPVDRTPNVEPVILGGLLGRMRGSVRPSGVTHRNHPR
jgi:hypothetical protein